MGERRGLAYCRSLLANKRSRNDERYRFYEMKNKALDLPVVLQERAFRVMQMWALGWCAKAVDSLADRLVFKAWKDDNFNISQIFQLNNPDIFFDSAIMAALISGCCFVYISLDENGYPKLQVLDGRKATGVIDPTTNMLLKGMQFSMKMNSVLCWKPISNQEEQPIIQETLSHTRLAILQNTHS